MHSLPLRRLSLAALLLAVIRVHATGSISDVEHVVLFMQENRAFDHYFGTMAGVRGFQDPNVQNNKGTAIWFQDVDSSVSDEADELLPWYINYLHGSWDAASQCMHPGSNSYKANHGALNGDLNNQWVNEQSPWSWGHYTRAELPVHFAIAEGWTVGDMYQESIIASTSPNRVAWLSGSINTPGGPQSPSQGGMYIDNNETPGCEGTNLNCYPLKWTTAPEYWQKAGSWQVYQDSDNFDDNPLSWFEQYQNAAEGSPLQSHGLAHVGLERFYSDAASGNLPNVSVIIAPQALSEHPPNMPRDGAWLQAQVVNAVTSSPLYNSTVLIISYDESGGWGDHVTPYHSPEGTAAEWIEDPYGRFGHIYIGPGFRTPFYIVSPWTRGPNVYVEHADHSSQLMFIEKWLTAKGHANVETPEIPAWRRANMADLTKAFNFEKPDYSLPFIPNVTYPSTDSSGKFNGATVCGDQNERSRPPPPYGAQTQTTALTTEYGFKKVRGQLTEGRYLVFESGGQALSSSKGKLSSTTATPQHDGASQRFTTKQQGPGSKSFELFDLYGRSMGTYAIDDLGSGKGYTLQQANGTYLNLGASNRTSFQVYSVSYADQHLFMDREDVLDHGAAPSLRCIPPWAVVTFCLVQLCMVFYI